MQDISTRPTALKYGLIYAGVMIVYSGITYATGIIDNTFWDTLSYVIYAGLIGMAISEYKKLNEGYLSIKQGVGLSGLLVLVGAVISGGLNSLYLAFFGQDFLTKMLEVAELEISEQEGMTPEAYDMAMGWSESLLQPIPLFFVGLIVAVLVGLAFGLILSAIMKNNRPIMDYEE